MPGRLPEGRAEFAYPMIGQPPNGVKARKGRRRSVPTYPINAMPVEVESTSPGVERMHLAPERTGPGAMETLKAGSTGQSLAPASAARGNGQKPERYRGEAARRWLILDTPP